MPKVDNFSEVKIFNHDKFTDLRGELFTLWKSDETPHLNFNHDKIAVSKKDVLRGLHTDKSWKLITCLHGKIQLVVVDYLKNSENFLKWNDYILDANSKELTSVLVPPGFLNGHLVLSEEAIFYYKWCYEGDYPDVKDQSSVKWNDPAIDITWIVENPILSDRDNSTPYIVIESEKSYES